MTPVADIKKLLVNYETKLILRGADLLNPERAMHRPNFVVFIII